MTDYPTCCHACGRARDSKAERKWRKAIREENAKLRKAMIWAEAILRPGGVNDKGYIADGLAAALATEAAK